MRRRWKLLASGAAVALWDIDAAALDKAVASLKHSGRVHAAVVDVTDEASIAAAVDALIRDVGRIDILVNNAGITGGNAPLWQLAPEVWRRVIEVNLVGAVSGLPRGGAAYDRRRLRPHRQYRLDCRQGRQSECLALFGVESGPDRADQVARQGTGDAQACW